jgi:hypothetical protein
MWDNIAQCNLAVSDKTVLYQAATSLVPLSITPKEGASASEPATKHQSGRYLRAAGLSCAQAANRWTTFYQEAE